MLLKIFTVDLPSHSLRMAFLLLAEAIFDMDEP